MSIIKVLAAAHSEVGVREVPEGSNWGPRVSKYIREGGYDEPVFWCMCFCTAMLRWTLGSQARPWPRTGSCDVVLRWARKSGILHKQPMLGDVFLVMSTDDDAVHTGFVSAISGGFVDTIEGNTNDDGSTNGIGVFTRRRSIQNLRFVRWIEAMPEGLADDGVSDTSQWTAKIGPSIVPLEIDGAGRTIGPARAILEALEALGKVIGVSADLRFDPEAQSLMLRGDRIGTQVSLKNGQAYLAVRELAAYAGADLAINGRVITLE